MIIKKFKQNVCKSIGLSLPERSAPLEPVEDNQALTGSRSLSSSSPSRYQKMLVCKMSKTEEKKEAREVISVSVLIASGIIGTLLGSLHELPASQKTAPTAPLHSCGSFEKNIASSSCNFSGDVATKGVATYING